MFPVIWEPAHLTVSSKMCVFDSLQRCNSLQSFVQDQDYILRCMFLISKKEPLFKVIRSGIALYWQCWMFVIRSKEPVHKCHSFGKQTIYFTLRLSSIVLVFQYISVLSA